MKKIAPALLGLLTVMFAESAWAKDLVQFDLVCDESPLVGKIKYGGTGPSDGYDENAFHRLRISVDLKRNLYVERRAYGNLDGRIVAVDWTAITFKNSNGFMESWDKRSSRRYSAQDNYDHTVVIRGGPCKVAKYTPF